MATAKKLPSGSWRVRVYDKVKGKYISFTAGTKKEAELLGAEYLNGVTQERRKEKTLGECIEEYITLGENSRSPSTTDKYRRIKKNYLLPFCDISPSDLQQDKLQGYFNGLALKLSAKTLSDIRGFLQGVLNVYAPQIQLKLTLPKKQKKIKHFPDIKQIMQAVQGTEIELPCMLALWQGMRMSEVRGARKSDINGNVLTIQNVIVTVDGKHIEKTQTKTYDSTRQVVLSDYIMQLVNALPEEQEHLTELSGQAIYKRFVRLMQKHGIEGVSFHDLRHLNASTMLALGVPDKYAMERGGWSSTNIMKSVYQHTITDERKRFDSVVDEYFNGILKSMT